MLLAKGNILGNRYRIDALLGSGGMGAVYRAWDLRLDRYVAIKENALASPESARQFEREAKMMARLRHPNLPTVSDHFVARSGAQYLVMDYIEGEDLGQMLQRAGPLDESRAIAWIQQVCDALIYLHSQRPPIIHRDIKPANIKIAPDASGTSNVYLVDFGIAKVGDAQSKTAVGALGVTAGFSPPEQYGEGGTDARSDVYALGATLYALLTGQTPPDSVRLAIKAAVLPRPRTVRSDISPAVASAVEAALQTSPTDRPQTVAAFRALLPRVAPALPFSPRWAPTAEPSDPESARDRRAMAQTVADSIQAPPPAEPWAQAAGPRSQRSAPPGARLAPVEWPPTESPPSRPSELDRPKPPRSMLWLVAGAAAAIVLIAVVVVLVLRTGGSTPSTSFRSTEGRTEQPAATETRAADTPELPTTEEPGPPPTEEPGPTWTNTPEPMGTEPLAPTFTATPEPVVTDTETPTIEPTPADLAYVLIPAGSMRYGSTRADVNAVVAQLCSDYTESDPWCLAAAFEDETPASDVYVDSFYIDLYEVTNADYALCVTGGACSPPEREGANPRHEYYYDPGYADYAVVYVTWHDAQAYCTWVGGRLPTAHEWEKAARGDDGRWWPWGNTKPTYEANFRVPGADAAAEEDARLVGGDIQPVGSYSEDRSPYGIMDMSGNVMEWVDAMHPDGGNKRQIRGGSWNTGSFSTRAASLVGVGPNRAFFDVGFRCARDAGP